MKSIYFLFILVIALISLLLWEIWPDQFQIINLNYQINQNEEMQRLNCAGLSSLLEREWEIRIPKTISTSEKKKVSVVLKNPPQTDLSNIAEAPACNLAVEVHFDVSGIDTIPGSRIIESYQLGANLIYEWRISTQKGNGSASGTIWIYLLINEKDGQITRYPLFALPVEFRSHSFFGISPRVWRIILFSLCLFFTGIYFLLISKKGE